MDKTSIIGSGKVHVDEKNNRITMSGTTGIDWPLMVETGEKADRSKGDKLLKSADKNTLQMKALRECQAIINKLKNTVEKIYGAASEDAEKNVFNAMAVRTMSDDLSEATSPRVLVSLKSSAKTGISVTPGIFEIKILKLATSHKIVSGALTGVQLDKPLGFEGDLVFLAPGTGEELPVIVTPEQSLQTISTKITDLNAGLSAKILSPRATEHRLLIQAKDTGDMNGVRFATWSTKELLENQLKLARHNQETFEFEPYQESQTAGDAELNIDGVEIKVPSNIIEDVIPAVTLRLMRVSGDTPTRIVVEPDLLKIGQTIMTLVQTFNELVVFINNQTAMDSGTKEPLPSAYLHGHRLAGDIKKILLNVFSGIEEVAWQAGIEPSRINPIKLRKENEYKNTLEYGTAEIDVSVLERILSTNLDEFKRVMTFDFKASDPDLVLLALTQDMREKPPTIIKQNDTEIISPPFQLYLELLSPDRPNGYINNVTSTWSDGDMVVEDKKITITSGPAKGLNMSYVGNANRTKIDVEYTIGAMAPIYFSLQNFLDSENGQFKTELDRLDKQNQDFTERSKQIYRRSTEKKEKLSLKYTKMDLQLSKAEQTRKELENAAEAWFKR